MSQDLRSYIALIREKKLLLDIKKEVDPLTNLAGIAYRGENEQGKATMFHNLKRLPGLDCGELHVRQPGKDGFGIGHD